MENSVRSSRRSSIAPSSTAPPCIEPSLRGVCESSVMNLQAGKNGAPEIKGYSREYLEANSPRSQQIQEHLKEAGLSGAGPAQIAAHRTREEKLPLDRSDVKAQHRAVAEAHGNQPSRVVREARERGPAQTHEPARHAHAAVTYARDKCFEREAVVDQRDLMKEALKHASGQGTVRARVEGVRRASQARRFRRQSLATDLARRQGSTRHRRRSPTSGETSNTCARARTGFSLSCPARSPLRPRSRSA